MYASIVLYLIVGLLIHLLMSLKKPKTTAKAGWKGLIFTTLFWPIGLLLMVIAFMSGIFTGK